MKRRDLRLSPAGQWAHRAECNEEFSLSPPDMAGLERLSPTEALALLEGFGLRGTVPQDLVAKVDALRPKPPEKPPPPRNEEPDIPPP